MISTENPTIGNKARNVAKIFRAPLTQENPGGNHQRVNDISVISLTYRESRRIL